MERDFLKTYNTELSHIRQMAGEFAREYPKIASRLALDKDAKEICPDPFVERLLEGFAYLTSRVQVKLDAEFPRLTQALLETVYPQYLAPTPSMAVLRFVPDFKNKGLATGFTIDRGTTLRTFSSRSDHSPCTYRTAHAVRLWPLRLRQANYLDRSLLSLELPPEAKREAAIRMIFETTADLTVSEIELDRLTFFLRGADSLPASVMEHLFSSCRSIWARDPDDPEAGWRPIPLHELQPVGLANDESLLPHDPRTFEGFRLLMEYFAFPQRFLFFRVAGLREVIRHFRGKRLELAFSLSDADPKLSSRMNASMFELYCTPVVNLFEKRTDRIPLSSRFAEYHVVVDRSRPLDYEVYSVRSVSGYGAQVGEEQPFHPFYMAGDLHGGQTSYYTLFRRARTLTERERQFGRLSSYVGSEVFISVVDTQAAPVAPELEQLGLRVLCTNRHLPLRLTHADRDAEFAVEFNGPVVAVDCLSGPTVPKPSYAVGEISWRLISQLSLNYFSITDASARDGGVALREVLKLYVNPNDRSASQQIDGIVSVETASILRRITTPGIITFGRGIEVKVTLDEEAFAGTGVFLLGMVLEQFFAKHVAINSFTETVIHTKQRGEVIRWPARTGRKRIL